MESRNKLQVGNQTLHNRQTVSAIDEYRLYTSENNDLLDRLSELSNGFLECQASGERPSKVERRPKLDWGSNAYKNIAH